MCSPVSKIRAFLLIRRPKQTVAFQPVKHSFFYAVLFMTALVLGSILIYSFYLPQTAPKQITFAVLPFTEDGEYTPLSVGFSAVLRDSIALSRDVVVVDSVSTNAVSWDPQKASSLASILGITHFVDGNLNTSRGNLARVDFRVVNVSQPNWKEVTSRTESIPEAGTHALQDVRDALTVQIRESLYDNSFMRTEPSRYDATDFRNYIDELGGWHLSFKGATFLGALHKPYVAKVSRLFDATSITTHPSRELSEEIDEFLDSKDVHQYGESLWLLAGEYPNSLAVEMLAQFAFDLRKFRVAEKLWLRVARIQPHAAYPALEIANVRRLLDDLEGTEQAFQIAKLRDEIGIAATFYAINTQFHESPASLTSPRTFTVADVRKFTPQWQSDDPFDTDDALIEAMIYADSFDAPPAGYRTSRLWRMPPKFMSEQDPRWLNAGTWLKQNFASASVAVDEEVLAQATSGEAVDQLFAPRRSD